MKKPSKRAPGVKEPLQIYMTADERHLLDSLSADTGLSRAEVLRRGLRSFAAEQGGEGGPMQSLLRSLRHAHWTSNIATEHDEQLARTYTDQHNQ
jgi:hypothetical protein